MKVHLIRIPEYDPNKLEEIADILNSYDGPLEFVVDGYKFNKKQFEFLGRTWRGFEFEDDKFGVQSDADDNTSAIAGL